MKFIVTQELGRLAKWLRILGFDTIYFNKDDNARLVLISLRENRVILTRNSRMSHFSGIRMVCLKDDFFENQLKQVIDVFRLKIKKGKMFTICVDCNTTLKRIAKKDIKDKVPEYVYKTQKIFMKCPKCNKVFWQGTHWALAEKFLKNGFYSRFSHTL